MLKRNGEDDAEKSAGIIKRTGVSQWYVVDFTRSQQNPTRLHQWLISREGDSGGEEPEIREMTLLSEER